MKKILLIAATIFAFTAVFSQDAPKEKPRTFSIGPSIGFGHTGIRNTPGTDLFKPTYSAGLIINYSTTEHVGFAADFLWSHEGGLYEDNNGRENELSLEYLRIPLKVAYFMGDFEDNFRPKITVGPSIGFLLDADSYLEGTGSEDVDNLYEDFDLGVNASVGFNLKLKTNIWLNTDFNYYTSFMPIRGEQYNSNFGLKVGLAFGL